MYGTDIATSNGGGIRGDRVYGPGDLAKKDVLAMLPFGNFVVSCTITGQQLNDYVEGALGCYPDQCGDFLALFVNVGRTNRRYANEFWVEEVPGSNPTSRGVVMSWFPGGGGLREIASALVDVPSEGVAEGSEKSVSAVKTPLLFLRPAKGAYTCVGRLAPVRTRVSGEGGARVDFHLVDAPVLRERDPEAFSRLVDVGPEGFS